MVLLFKLNETSSTPTWKPLLGMTLTRPTSIMHFFLFCLASLLGLSLQAGVPKPPQEAQPVPSWERRQTKHLRPVVERVKRQSPGPTEDVEGHTEDGKPNPGEIRLPLVSGTRV